jgi:hypothetical protein
VSAAQLDSFGALGCQFWIGTMAGDGVSDWSGLTLFRRMEWSCLPLPEGGDMSMGEDKFKE